MVNELDDLAEKIQQFISHFILMRAKIDASASPPISSLHNHQHLLWRLGPMVRGIVDNREHAGRQPLSRASKTLFAVYLFTDSEHSKNTSKIGKIAEMAERGINFGAREYNTACS